MAVYTTIDDPSVYFQNKTYTGNGSTQSITLDGDTDLQPDLLWIKCSSAIELHTIVDSVRGDSTENSGYFYYQSNTNGGEQAHSGNTLVDAITSDGFNIGNNDQVNLNTGSFVAWAWKAGTTSGITTDGSTDITPSAYSFNATSRISIVKYAGATTAGQLAHGLGTTPTFHIIKKTSGTGNWQVYSKAVGNTATLTLNEDYAPDANAYYYNNTDPDSVNITLGSGSSNTSVNTSGQTYMCYSFADVQGFSKVSGAYTGNGNADGPFLFCGFRPSWFMTKRTATTGAWRIRDVKREPGQPLDAPLYANTNIAQNDGDNDWDVVSNGLKMRGSGTGENASGEKYIFVAFAESPFVNSNGVPNNAR